MKTIDIKPVKIQTLLSDNFFTIPAFQRDYVWDDKNVEAYFNDIYESFDDNKSEYYLGNIVLAKEEDGRWAIVDGQQRLTTTSLFIKSFMSFIDEYQMDEDKIVKKLYGVLEELIQDFDTQTKQDLNRISFLYEENRDFMEELYKSKHDEIKQFKHRNLSKTQQNLFNAYILLFTLIEKNFYEKNSELSDFLSYFMNSVLFSVVSTDDLGNALFIFQTLNDRGVGLAPTDLLKNLLLMNDKHNKTEQIVKRWKEFIDTIDAGSKWNQNIKPDRFLRHYIMAKFGKHDLKVTDVFEYIQSHKKELNIGNNPLDFLADIQKRAYFYVNYYQGIGRNGEVLEALENMRELRFMSQLLLLMFADKMPEECFNDFCKRLENLLFAYTISGKLTKEFESLFCRWASIISNIDSEDTYNVFIKENFEPEFKEQKTLFYNNFLALSQRGQTQYRQRYILAKLDQILEHAVSGNQKLTRSEIVNANKEIEHILPQTPEDELRHQFEESLEEEETYDDYVIRFGNLTLLPKTINIVASNHFFEQKCKEYTGINQNFKLTHAICKNIKIGDNSRLNRILNYAEIINFTVWDRNSILKRQKQLAKLALLVWGFDEI